MAEKNSKVLLSLTTVRPDRPLIDIDGELYPIRTREDMGLEQLANLDALVKRYYEILMEANAGKTLGPEDSASLSQGLIETVELFVDAPKVVLDKLTDVQRIDICLAFSQALPPQTPKAAVPTANRAGRRSTGTRQSPRSNGSMAATPKAGIG